jgi:hypothetical protein
MTLAAWNDLRALAQAVQPADASPLTANELSARFGWLVTTLQEWDRTHDPHGRRLYGALAAASVWDFESGLWHVLSPLLSNVDRLVAALDRILSSRQIQPTAPPNTPLWEREHLDKLLEADQREDWIVLAELAHAFPLPITDGAFNQATRAQFAIGYGRLVPLISKQTTWLGSVAFLAALPFVDACRIAADSGAPRIRFTVLELATVRLRRELSRDESEALRLLLVESAKDEMTWPAFMQAFNRYPARYPVIQRPLGLTLATATTAAIHAYVDAIELSAGDSGADAVANCLTAFRCQTSTELRRVLWNRAYERWSLWNFDLASGKNLITPARSVLDFAVLGWLLESAPVDFAQTEIAAFGIQLQAIDAEWHASVTTLRSAVNRLLSRYQLFARAIAIRAGSLDWLDDVHPNLPTELASAFASARYGRLGVPGMPSFPDR